MRVESRTRTARSGNERTDHYVSVPFPPLDSRSVKDELLNGLSHE